MILDLKKNLGFYKNLGIEGRYAKAVDFLQNTDLEKLEPGKYEIDGNNVYANVQEYETIPWEDAKYESHRDYTDIQYIISGVEVMGYAPAETLTVSVPFNEAKDVVLYDNSIEGLKAAVNPGEYMIFNPWDGHKPKAAAGAPAHVKKVIIKIKEN